MPDRGVAAAPHRDSRFPSRGLRHATRSIGLTLDANGRADVEAQLGAARAHGRPLTAERLRAVVAGNDKQRLAFDPAGRRLRAVQGHSVDIDLGLPPRTPPVRLYHGTAACFLDATLREGLARRSRRHGHLSTTPATARAAGARHGPPAVPEVKATASLVDGPAFFPAGNGVRLTDPVAPALPQVLDAPAGGP